MTIKLTDSSDSMKVLNNVIAKIPHTIKTTNGKIIQIEIDDSSLSVAQKSAISTFLTAHNPNLV